MMKEDNGGTVEYRLLTGDDEHRMYDTFIESFSDYELDSRVSFVELSNMMARRGTHFDLSVGAFDDGAMVAVMATGLGIYQGRTTAYDVFTGVTRSYRGRGIAGGMFAYVRDEVRRRGAQRFVLEVLQSNEAGIKAYTSAGFEPVRELMCYTISSDDFRGGGNQDVEIDTVDQPDWHLWDSFRGWEPSWQNSSAAVGRGNDETVLLVARAGDRCAGYAAAGPQCRDLFQVAVAPEFRRQGIGTRLVAEALAYMPRGMRVINVDKASPDPTFFRSIGARELARQFEMHLKL